ncbi:MAG TPA: ABC transporter ATP-binding protein [Terriglobia bacterium]|nr:ABC transporter ATP-binding protein [Terriglobia bacterium]
MLRLTDIELVKDGKQILHDLNLEVRKGEIRSILGVNGTGKSTLAYVVMGLSGYEPTAGRILLDEEDITKLSISERAKRGITLAWQEPARFEGLTVEEYLELGRRHASYASLSPSECLEKIGLQPARYLQRPVDGTLSGGERRRIELASILAMSPRLAILDEPDSGIDALSMENIVEVIRTLSRNGTAVLLITHHEEVAEIADRASSLCGGTILKTGEPTAIARFYRNHCQECPHVNVPLEQEANHG